MHVEFSKRPDGGSLALIDRDDGVRLRLRSYDRTGEVPHDAVHLVGERALGLTGGLWGSIAAGAVFDSVEVVSGTLRHDRQRKSDAIRRENAEQLRLAETVVGVLQQSIDRDGPATKAALDEAWGITRTGASPYPADRAATAVGELRELRRRWRDLAPEETIPYDWDLRRPRR
ncbi:hypothetical protein Acsp06_64960 [Actinomycetospora sp. NBRC 106375]|uniref:hypothetical protein n=1 Tax=Actinomycetospora sp. NBRC 106375 TaxID=3032207 RepID=UPI0024A507CA|nr:hypothetical protein [Actinomycetospora sp. NBRC 106375]GLZ50311.1 hypothetical protein Acsp06_64960 [Actinomycetospora sp. NBRC 106375]